MKKHLFSTAAICLVSLFAASCVNNAAAPELSDEISETETVTEFIEAETAAQITEKVSKTETTSEETAQKNTEEITTVQKAQEQVKQKLPLIVDLDAAGKDGSKSYGVISFVSGSLWCEKGYHSTDNGNSVMALYFFDVDSLSFVKTIDLPKGWIGFEYDLPSDSPDVLLKYKIYRYDENNKEEYGLMTIFNNYSYEIKEHYEYSDQMEHFSGHDVFLQYDGIYLADDDTPKKIVEFQAFEKLYSIHPIDGGFAYSVIDMTEPYSKCPITAYTYSFDSGSERLESLDDAHIISSNGGKLFSYKKNGLYDTTLYVTDLTARSTTLLSETEFETDHGCQAIFAVTSDGSKILCAAGKNKDGSLPSSVYVLDAASGEIIDVHELPEELGFHSDGYSSISCISYGGKEIAAVKCSREEKVYLFEI